MPVNARSGAVWGTALTILTMWLLPAPARAQYSVLSPQDQVRLDALAREQARQDAEYHASMREAKARLLKAAPLPEARNPLLGRLRRRLTGPNPLPG